MDMISPVIRYHILSLSGSALNSAIVAFTMPSGPTLVAWVTETSAEALPIFRPKVTLPLRSSPVPFLVTETETSALPSPLLGVTVIQLSLAVACQALFALTVTVTEPDL